MDYDLDRHQRLILFDQYSILAEVDQRNKDHLSPRLSAALLRVALEKLCHPLEAEGGNLNEMIGWLVANRELNPVAQPTLDVVRVVGNEAVHPGKLDQRDSVKDANVMFTMLNEIVIKLITRPKRVRELYDSLPESVKQAILARDEKAAPKAGKKN